MEGEIGLLHVYTGDGKGKTTAALGMCARAVGHGYRALVVQFMKTGGTYGENFLRLPGLEVVPSGHDCLVFSDKVTQADLDKAAEGLRLAGEAMRSGKYRMVVLDEVSVAIKFRLLDVNDVVSAVNGRAEGVEAVITGRYAPPELLEMADYISEVKAVRHPYEKGLTSRKGVDR
ncbi:MAG: cob(I)yrinic acid a,c-diamide adenosyltransferase [Euryarchaeota archaeon]|nr:cob(I)yrinic acid a,c-diamide adenosyltransferase [Euryarchaeota archaeon]